MTELSRRARLGVLLATTLAVAAVGGILARAAMRDEPVTRRETRCYFPPEVDDGPAIELVVPATSRVQIVARLHEIRGKAAELAPPGSIGLDAPPAPGTHSELDALISSLIGDLDPEADPPAEEARP